MRQKAWIQISLIGIVWLCLTGCGQTQPLQGDTPSPSVETTTQTAGKTENEKSEENITWQEPSQEEQPVVEQTVICEIGNSAVFDRINGCSYVDNEYISLEELRYVQVPYYGFDGKSHVGELIVHRDIAEDVAEIFLKLYEARYPIERMQLVDDFGADDEASMEANNTSAFNFRMISGTTKLSNHSYGRAIDVNPFYNPYVYTGADGEKHCEPAGAEEYIDREADNPYQIDEEDLCYRLFTERGFSWGGSWEKRKDYQHFERMDVDKERNK